MRALMEMVDSSSKLKLLPKYLKYLFDVGF